MQFNLRGILLKWLPICPPIKHLRNASLGLLRLFWCAFKKPVCAEGAHSQLAGTQWLHLSLKVNTHRGGPQIWPFQMPRPPRLSILRDNEQIPIQKRLLCDSVALWCPQHTWVNEWATSLLSKARSELSGAVNVTSVMIHLRWTNGELHYSKTCLTHWHQSNLKTFHWGLKSFCHEVLSGSVVPNLFCLIPPPPAQLSWVPLCQKPRPPCPGCFHKMKLSIFRLLWSNLHLHCYHLHRRRAGHFIHFANCYCYFNYLSNTFSELFQLFVH